MKHQRTNLSLQIKHPTRDLSAVCDAFGLRPARLWKVGDERRTPKGNKIGGIRTESACSVHVGPTARKPLSKQIEAALVLLKPHRRMLRNLSSTGGKISFFVGWFCDEHTGESLNQEILEEMADLRIGLDLNIYIPDY
jgi:Domain of unknown function (DUF4279)